MKNTVLTFARRKREGEKITMLTAYDYTTAKLMDEAGVDCLLVGDSLGMVMLGYEDTLSVTMEDMIHHTGAVARGVKNALIVADLPFMSYQASVRDALVNAGRLLKEGRANAVKMEGGREICPQIRAAVDASIPVMGHLGLTPQSVNAFGGYRVQGRELRAAHRLIEDAEAVEEAGAFAVVLECVPAELSGGEQQRFCVARILQPDVKFLIADEMTAMFDAITQAKMWAAISDYARERSIGMVVISHDPHLLNRLCDRIVVL